MADKGGSSRGVYILSFFTFVNFAAFVGVAVYHVQYERSLHSEKLFTGKEIFNELLDEVKGILKPGQKQSVDSLYPELKEAILSHRAILVQECRQEVLESLAQSSNPNQHDVHKRQTSSPGNDLANIFGEIAKTEVDILVKYCNNGSFVCLPGQKGEVGLQGVKGNVGSKGLKGEMGMTPKPAPKGDTGPPGMKGAKGMQGKTGINGIKGDTGDNGTDGQSITGPKGEVGLRGVNGSDGRKGQKGEMGMSPPPAAKGDAGAPGTKGAKGMQGKTGINGIKGDQGENGTDGHSITGQKGEVGLQGVKGDAGIKGLKGEMGMSPPPAAKGDAGVPGAKGAKGDPGIAGVNGIKGDKGDNGTDGQSITGPPGPKGKKGDSADVVPVANQCCNNLKTPDFSLQVETIRALEGSNISLNCNPAGYPPPTIVWTPQLSTLDPARTSATPARVTINNAQVSDGHLYTCLANNALGTSEKQFLVSIFKHIKFDAIPQNYTVLLLKPVTLECMIEGPLGPHIAWYKIMPDGSRFLLTNNITPIVNGSQLHIDHVTNADVGQYVCEGSNGVETVTKTAYIRTYGPPHIIPPGTVYAQAGQDKVLKCETDSYPPSNITWNYPPGVTNAYKETDGTLMVLGAKPKDATYFICTATNEYGTDQATLQLKVNVPPTAIVTPGNVNISSGVTSIVLECKVTGDAPLTVTWSKQGTPIATDGHYLVLTGNVLYINQPTIADVGNYTCTASNPLGISRGVAIVV